MTVLGEFLLVLLALAGHSSPTMARSRLSALAARPPRARRAPTVYRFSRFTTPYSLPKSTADQGFGVSFNLADVVNSSEFTALFDEFRVVGVEVVAIVTGINTPGGTYPLLYTYPDFDDATAPSTQSVALQVTPLTVWAPSASNPVKRYRISPKLALTTGGSGAVASSAWADVAYPSIPWYGWKGWVANYNTSVYPGTFIQLMFKLDLEFRGVR